MELLLDDPFIKQSEHLTTAVAPIMVELEEVSTILGNPDEIIQHALKNFRRI